MPAATATASNGYANLTEMVDGAVRNLIDEQRTAGYAQVMAFGESYTVATTNIDSVGDILRLIKFPAGAYIWDLRITASDMDTNATPTLAFDVLAIDDSDVTKATLISATTIGQDGTAARIADTGVGEFVGNYWLALKITTGAATGAAGTVKVVFTFSVGLMNVTGNGGGASSLNPRLTDAAL